MFCHRLAAEFAQYTKELRMKCFIQFFIFYLFIIKENQVPLQNSEYTWLVCRICIINYYTFFLMLIQFLIAGDRQLMQSLVFDARVTKWFSNTTFFKDEKRWVLSHNDCILFGTAWMYCMFQKEVLALICSHI